jgi:hypothetical protein
MTLSTMDAGRRIEACFDAAPDFARAICRKLERIILKAEPGMVREWKWGPHYSKNGTVCGIGVFKKHVSLAFFQGASMEDPEHLFIKEDVPARSMRRIRFVTLRDVREPVIAAYVKEAVALNAGGVKKPERTIDTPADLEKQLSRSKRTAAYFSSLSYTHRKEYIRWIGEAKKEETRSARIAKTVEMLKSKIKHP